MEARVCLKPHMLTKQHWNRYDDNNDYLWMCEGKVMHDSVSLFLNLLYQVLRFNYSNSRIRFWHCGKLFGKKQLLWICGCCLRFSWGHGWGVTPHSAVHDNAIKQSKEINAFLVQAYMHIFLFLTSCTSWSNSQRTNENQATHLLCNERQRAKELL